MKFVKSGAIVAFLLVAFLTPMKALAQFETKDAAPKAESAASGDRFDLESKEMKADAPVVKNVVPRKVSSRRLPNNYARVVSAKQREDIYAIQDQYLPLLNLLQARLELLKEEMDAKVQAVLTEEQLKSVREAATNRARR